MCPYRKVAHADIAEESIGAPQRHQLVGAGRGLGPCRIHSLVLNNKTTNLDVSLPEGGGRRYRRRVYRRAAAASARWRRQGHGSM